MGYKGWPWLMPNLYLRLLYDLLPAPLGLPTYMASTGTMPKCSRSGVYSKATLIQSQGEVPNPNRTCRKIPHFIDDLPSYNTYKTSIFREFPMICFTMSEDVLAMFLNGRDPGPPGIGIPFGCGFRYHEKLETPMG